MIRQWNLSREGYRDSGVFTPTPGDYHLFICSYGTSFTQLEDLMKKHNPFLVHPSDVAQHLLLLFRVEKPPVRLRIALNKVVPVIPGKRVKH